MGKLVGNAIDYFGQGLLGYEVNCVIFGFPSEPA